MSNITKCYCCGNAPCTCSYYWRGWFAEQKDGEFVITVYNDPLPKAHALTQKEAIAFIHRQKPVASKPVE